jgi:threonylcarbamoyladenosine tRNA methylthiotransferase MtaB
VADKKSRQAARRGKRRNPDAIVVVTGCYSQVAPEKVSAIRGVDVVVGTQGRADIVDLVELAMTKRSELPLVAVGDIMSRTEFEEVPISCPTKRIRGFVKIQEGCDEFCAYCRVPFARGPSRSRNPGHILEEVKRLADSGIREVVLTGIHVGAYGRDSASADDQATLGLPWLLEKIHSIPTIGRIRLSSIEPVDIDESLIEKVQGLPKVARHFHIPLQSGDDEVLERMGRRYQTRDYLRIVERIRGMIPDVAITTDIMVGFPGETEENFRKSYEFARSLEFSRMHVFKFSGRPGTRAFNMKNQVDSKTRHVRSEKMMQLAQDLESEFSRSLVGKDEEVLVEEYKSRRKLVAGIGSRYIRIEMPGGEDLLGTLVPVRVVGTLGAVVIAERLLQHGEGFEPQDEK